MTTNQYRYTRDELSKVTVDELIRLAGGDFYFKAIVQGDGEGGIILTIEPAGHAKE